MYQTKPIGNVGSEYIDIYGEKSQQAKEGGEVRKKSQQNAHFFPLTASLMEGLEPMNLLK